MPEHLTPAARQIIEQYLRLPFHGRTVSTPYFNNRRARVRGALRVLVGKGTPQDIVEEATIMALKEKIDLKTLSDEQLRQFLVNHHLGADCSGLVYHILDAHCHETHKKSLASSLHFPHATNFFRKILTRLRPAEHTNVATLAHEKNSFIINIKDIQPGDLIAIQGFGPNRDRDHILLIHSIEKLESEVRPARRSIGAGGSPKSIHYTHSFQWSTDGTYNHGVRQGVIEIIDLEKPLLGQRWIEQEKMGQENETYRHAAQAQTLSIRRFAFL